MKLQIRNLSKTYPNGVEALKEITLTIPQGMYGLLGPNGAGKSTLMRTIATLQEPDAGSIHLGDIDVLAERGGAGEWQVTLDVRARKVVVNEEGVETEVPMDDLVEIGVLAATGDGGTGVPLYLRMHRVHSGEQRITLTVPGEPARAGIDPRNLLIDVEARDKLAEVTSGGAP